MLLAITIDSLITLMSAWLPALTAICGIIATAIGAIRKVTEACKRRDQESTEIAQLKRVAMDNETRVGALIDGLHRVEGSYAALKKRMEELEDDQ